MAGELPFDPLQFADPNAGRRKLDDMLGFDPFFGAPPKQQRFATSLRPDYDDIVGESWKIDEEHGRDAANAFLIEKGFTAIPESDGK